jgi:WD40 repeat protein
MEPFNGHTGCVTALAVTPDGLRVVSGSDDKTLRLWSLETGKMIRILEGHTEHVWTVAITPDGRRAVSGSFDRTLRLALCRLILGGNSQKHPSDAVRFSV